jgi:hypothetical protein
MVQPLMSGGMLRIMERARVAESSHVLSSVCPLRWLETHQDSFVGLFAIDLLSAKDDAEGIRE